MPAMADPAFCDLHLHSTASDGTDAPGDLPRLVKAAGLSAFALTDHDTTAGLVECAAAAKKLKLDFVPGIELSANPDLDGAGSPRGTLHLLGYFIDPDHAGLAEISNRMARARDERNPRIVEKLNGLGVRMDYDEVVKLARDLAGGDARAVVGRPHIGQLLIAKGYVKSMHEAFNKYLGAGGEAYTRRDRLDAAEAIDTVHAAGGLICLAHPVQLKLEDDAELEHAVARLVDLGLDAIETRHSDHTPADMQQFTKLATRFGLLTSGGSDYHGSRKSVTLGGQRVPIGVYEGLRDAAVSAI
jgi:predicted metal-dependent phosphoesterase TrpH